MSRLARFAPLTGVAFALLIPVAFASGTGAPPTSPTAVRDYFIHNGSASQVSDNLWMLGLTFLLFFGGSLHATLPASRSLATLLVAGAALMAAGGGVYFGSDFTVSSDAQSLSPDAAQAINALALTLVFPLSMGGAVFGIATGLAIWRTHCPAQVAWRCGLCHRPRPGQPACAHRAAASGRLVIDCRHLAHPPRPAHCVRRVIVCFGHPTHPTVGSLSIRLRIAATSFPTTIGGNRVGRPGLEPPTPALMHASELSLCSNNETLVRKSRPVGI